MKSSYKKFKASFLKEVKTCTGSYIITSHKSPDPDSLSSCLALAFYLNNGLKVPKTKIKIYYEGEGSLWSSNYNKDFAINFVKNVSKKVSKSDLVIVLDTNAPSNVSSSAGFANNTGSYLVIDHHKDNGYKYKFKLIDDKKISCVEILYELFFKNEKGLLNTDFAEIILSGILGDSGNFNFVTKEKVSTFDTVKDIILSYNVSITSVRLRFFTYEPKIYPVLATLLKNYKIVDLTNIGWGKVGYTFYDKNKIDEAVMHSAWRIFASTYLSSTQGADWGFGFRQRKNDFDMSFRSNKGSFGVAKIAQYFGGGGHPSASGATFSKKDYPNLNADLAFKLILKYLKTNKPTFIT